MKKKASFVVDILETRNHTWQGKLLWVNENRTRTFRSALELMQLISSAVEPDEVADIGEDDPE